MIFVRTPWQFYTARFLLGMAEAGFSPESSSTSCTGSRPEQRARTVSRFYVAIPLSAVLMGSVAGALLNLNGRLGPGGMAVAFLVEALPAVVLGIISSSISPIAQPTPHGSRHRAERHPLPRPPPAASRHNESILPTLRHPRVWLLGIFMFCMLASNYAYVFTAPVILQKATGSASPGSAFSSPP